MSIRDRNRTRALLKCAVALGSLTVLAAAGQAAAQDASNVQQTAAEKPPEDAPADAAAAETEIVVTGTSIRGVAPVGSQLIQVGQAEIIERGVQSTAGLLATIPQLDSFSSRPTPENGGRMPITPPSLRGLGAGATLNLLNSHRLVGIGTVSTTSDPTSLPIAAIARIEVVPDGASAVYGSDAVAGVINVILRKDLNGIDARASVGFADSYTEQVYSVVGGKTWSTGSILIGGQYQKNSALLGGDRDYITDNFTSVGGADNRTLFAARPNVTTPGGVTYGYTGNGTGPAAFGLAPNLVSPSREGDLIPGSRKWSAVLNAEQHVGDNIRLFADAHYGNLHTDFRNSSGANSGSAPLIFTITDANPYFQTPVPGVTSLTVRQGAYQFFGPYYHTRQDLEYWGVNGGAEVEFSDKWSARISSNYGHSHTLVDQDTYDAVAFAAAVASTDPATAYDPFTGKTSSATLARIRDAISNPGSTQRLFQVSGSVNGSLFALPGGDAKIAIGGEYRREWYDGFGMDGAASAPVTTFIHSKRNVSSIYGELFLPLVGEDNNVAGIRRLDFTAALRHDRYSDFGNTTNPKFGVNWEVVDGLTLRGTYGKSFHAPALSDLKAIDDKYFYIPGLPAGTIFTPSTGGPYNVVLLAGGNPNLKPEKATTWSLGADYSPTFAPNLRLNATYFDINYTDLVVVPFDKGFLTPALTQLLVHFNPSAADFAALTAGLTPASPAPFTVADTSFVLDARRRNLGGSHVKGMDFNAVYRFELGQSKLVAEVNGTHFFSKKTSTAPGTPPLDDLATTPFPAWRFRTHVGWELDRVRANVTWSHMGGYNNPAVVPVQRVSSFNPVDLNVSYKLPGFGFAKTLGIQLDVQNVFDEAPPTLYSGNGAAYAGNAGAPLSSPVGRMVQIGVRAEF